MTTVITDTAESYPVDTSFSFCTVFEDEKVKHVFGKFLQTIFYQLDTDKVYQGMEEILATSSDKSDQAIYETLCQKIDTMKKPLAPLWKLWSLRVLKQGMGKQAAQLLEGFKTEHFHSYMEVYDRRYLDVIRGATGSPLDQQPIAVSDTSDVGLADRIQAGAVCSSYPYKHHVKLNDEDCVSSAIEINKTYKPITSDEVADKNIDLIAMLGGLHHMPKDRIKPFIQALYRTLKPGAVLLTREHNIAEQGANQLSKHQLKALVSVVHSFVNASSGVPYEEEHAEIRDFKSIDEWVELFEACNFTSISSTPHILKDDPTENGMIAFVRNPENLEEMYEAIDRRSDYARSADSTRSTWIEWGNVRFSKQYAEFVQTHHSYAFDYMGHLLQHWQHFSNYIRESSKDVSYKDLIFSENFMMNVFILLSTTVQCITSAVTNLPSQFLARWQHGENWRHVSDLTALERYAAKVEKEYAEFIDHTPFYMFDYMGKIKGVWNAALRDRQGALSTGLNICSATLWSASLMATAAVSAPIKAFYSSEANAAPGTIKVLIHDPNGELEQVIDTWEAAKDQEHQQHIKIEEVYTTPDHYKLVSMPRYVPFTKICQYISKTQGLKLLKVAGNTSISIDVLLDKDSPLSTQHQGTKVYEMPRLQDLQDRQYETHYVPLTDLKQFLQAFEGHIEHIHE